MEEFNTFEANEKRLLKDYKGKFVLIYGSDILGIYSTEDEAMEAGNEKCTAKPYFIGEIGREPIITHPHLVGWLL